MPTTESLSETSPMPADIVNLRRARKQRVRSDKEAEAAANRAKFGRSKAERTQTEALDELARKRHAAHTLDPVAVVDPVADHHERE